MKNGFIVQGNQALITTYRAEHDRYELKDSEIVNNIDAYDANLKSLINSDKKPSMKALRGLLAGAKDAKGWCGYCRKQLNQCA